MIGIILLATIHCGQLLTKLSQFTTHVLLVGVFQTAEVAAFGQRLGLMILHTIRQMKEYLSAFHLLPQLGILLRVIATAAMAACTMSVTSVTIGLSLLAAAARTA